MLSKDLAWKSWGYIDLKCLNAFKILSTAYNCNYHADIILENTMEEFILIPDVKEHQVCE